MLQEATLDGAHMLRMFGAFDDAGGYQRRGKAANQRFPLTIYYANRSQERWMRLAKILIGHLKVAGSQECASYGLVLMV